jgi:protein phosphatase
MSVYASTDIGKRREVNQDAFLVADLTTGDYGPGLNTIEYPVGEKGTLLVVADGMGGAAAGEVASEMAVVFFCRAMMELSGLDAKERLTKAAEIANITIWNHARSDQKLRGMGTTLTAALVQDGLAHILQVGDSRAYVIRGDEIYQLTKDQSLAQALLDQGVLTQDQAAAYPRHIILQALGTGPKIEPDLTEKDLYPDDYLVLCSDGLSNKVSDSEIRDVIHSLPNLTEACDKLIALANERGGQDNITVIISRMEETDPILRSSHIFGRDVKTNTGARADTRWM